MVLFWNKTVAALRFQLSILSRVGCSIRTCQLPDPILPTALSSPDVRVGSLLAPDAFDRCWIAPIPILPAETIGKPSR